MIVCSCRNIKESDFPNKEDLLKRLQEKDYLCGTCVEEYKYNAHQSTHTQHRKV